ncbi:MAG: GatB/YqeY domain-containing protein [bacterium]|nr:GatB/YqeY domain-containing protein [bacterium]
MIKERVMEDMKAAMLARDTERLGALRLIKAEFLKAEKEKGIAIGEAREIAVLQSMLKQRRDSIEQFEKAGRADLAAKERAEAKFIGSYLPEGLSAEDIAAVIDSVIAEAGQPDAKQLGKIMGQVMAKLKATGKPFDAREVNATVRSKLGA